MINDAISLSSSKLYVLPPTLIVHLLVIVLGTEVHLDHHVDVGIFNLLNNFLTSEIAALRSLGLALAIFIIAS
jgi:hypothetical protein